MKSKISKQNSNESALGFRADRWRLQYLIECSFVGVQKRINGENAIVWTITLAFIRGKAFCSAVFAREEGLAHILAQRICARWSSRKSLVVFFWKHENMLAWTSAFALGRGNTFASAVFAREQFLAETVAQCACAWRTSRVLLWWMNAESRPVRTITFTCITGKAFWSAVSSGEECLTLFMTRFICAWRKRSRFLLFCFDCEYLLAVT